MTALAELLSAHGLQITGSDTEERFYTDEILKRLGISYSEHFSQDNISQKTELVIYSTAYNPETQPELIRAKELGIPFFSYPESVGRLTEERLTLAVCGTHGKTTTSALLAQVLQQAGARPEAIIGSRLNAWGGSALAGDGKYLVLEADEYQNKFQYYHPFAVILTSVDYDHPDFFETVADYERVFQDFITKIPPHGVLVYCGDESRVVAVAKGAKCHTLSYGLLPENDIVILPKEKKSGVAAPLGGTLQSAEIAAGGESLGIFETKLAGKHNLENLASVVALSKFLKLPQKEVRRGIAEFSGIARRFEFLGEHFGALIYDDYAHHPEELKVTLGAFHELYPERRLRAVFHPHTFSRTKALFEDFAQSFDEVDELIVLDIYGSAREKQGGVTSEELVAAINRYTPGKATAMSDYDEIVKHFEDTMGRNDVIISLGAGDVWKITHQLAKKI